MRWRGLKPGHRRFKFPESNLLKKCRRWLGSSMAGAEKIASGLQVPPLALAGTHLSGCQGGVVVLQGMQGGSERFLRAS